MENKTCPNPRHRPARVVFASLHESYQETPRNARICMRRSDSMVQCLETEEGLVMILRCSNDGIQKGGRIRPVRGSQRQISIVLQGSKSVTVNFACSGSRIIGPIADSGQNWFPRNIQWKFPCLSNHFPGYSDQNRSETVSMLCENMEKHGLILGTVDSELLSFGGI